MGLLDRLKGAAGEVLSDAKDDLVQGATDKIAEATGVDKVVDAVGDVTQAKESVEGAVDSVRDGLSNS